MDAAAEIDLLAADEVQHRGRDARDDRSSGEHGDETVLHRRAYRHDGPPLECACAAADTAPVRLFRGGRANRSSDAHERAQLAMLHETALGLIERLDLQELLEAIAERAGDLVGAGNGFLYLLEPDGRELRMRAGTGLFRELVGFRLRLGEGLSGRVAVTGESLVVDDHTTWEGSRPALRHLPFRAAVGVPLRRSNGVTGVLGLAHVESGRSFSPADVNLLLGYAQLGSLALENARLYEATQVELEQRRRTEEELLDTVARLSRSALELKRAHAETIRRLADAAEFRNAETGRHTERMSRYCELLAAGSVSTRSAAR